MSMVTPWGLGGGGDSALCICLHMHVLGDRREQSNKIIANRTFLGGIAGGENFNLTTLSFLIYSLIHLMGGGGRAGLPESKCALLFKYFSE